MNILKRLRIKMLLSIVLLFSMVPIVYATSWVQLEPAQVVEKAQLIVKGKYHIPDDYKDSSGYEFWIPFDFEVEEYYWGKGEKVIRAAIEQYDVGWVKEFQDRGGSFYLFLSEKEQDYWIPVSGPNGMVQIENGEIINRSPEDTDYYKSLLKNLKETAENNAEVQTEKSPINEAAEEGNHTSEGVDSVKGNMEEFNWMSFVLITMGAVLVIYSIVRRFSS